PLVFQGIAEIKVSFGKVGLQRYGLSRSSNRVVQFSLLPKGVAEVAIGFSALGLEDNGTPNQIHGEFMSSDLTRDDSEQVQGIGMARLDQQNLAIDRLRLSQSSGLMVRASNFKCLLDAHGFPLRA